MTRVLSVASECAPVVKTGGLADVVGALPRALSAFGDDVKTLLPGYRSVMAELKGSKPVLSFDDLFGGPGRVLRGKAAGLELLVLDAPHLFDRAGNPYHYEGGHDWPDNPERFAALSFAAARLCGEGVGTWRPDVVHGHDWQAGFIAEYLSEPRIPFVFTIHNIAFHGMAPPDWLGALRLNEGRFTQDHFEFWGQISALKAGLMGADAITTVSNTYAEELMTPEFGMGMDGVMRARAGVVSGIVNGIDTEVWDPASDPKIKPYKTPRGKRANKSALRKEFGLGETTGPLCVLVSRLTQQKGIDLLLDALPALLSRGGQLALLGSGEPGAEVALLERAAAEPNMAVRIGYDEALSHRMMAGGDAILVPSRFEPCGLTQLYGLRYGALPVVSLTGGLADTVINANPAALAKGVATGLQFSPVTSGALARALGRLCDLFADNETWTTMQKNAMKQPVGWESSAAEYSALFSRLRSH
ncbi:MAG: glycogen synthase GlgA [Pseudomonadota bacterium]